MSHESLPQLTNYEAIYYICKHKQSCTVAFYINLTTIMFKKGFEF